jgi:hypothetical protein
MESATWLLGGGALVVGIVVGWLLRRSMVTRDAEVLRARNSGLDEARREWSVTVSPWKRVDDGFFSTAIAVGYQCQLQYRGMPVGDATIRIVQEEKKVNKKEIERLIGVAEVAARAYVGSVRSTGAGAQLNGWSSS